MSEINELIKSDKPVLVDVWAAWCGPCVMMNPIISEITKELVDEAIVVKLDADTAGGKTFMIEHGIRSIPTFLLFKDGKQVWRHSGTTSKQTLVDVIKESD